MREVKITLAHQSGTVVPFRVTADGHAGIGDGNALKFEGETLADLVYDNLPGGTVDALIQRLHERYSKLTNRDINPFLDLCKPKQKPEPLKLRLGAHKFTVSDVGCHADGSLGLEYVRTRLRILLLDTFGFKSTKDLRKALARDMSDDDWETGAALELLNEHATDESVVFDFVDGDLVLSEVESDEE